MKYLALASLLALAACGDDIGTELITSTKQLVVLPEDKLYDCPLVDRFPDAATLTDIQVARLIVKLHDNNVRCHNSVEAVRKFLEQAKKTAEEKSGSE